MLKEKNPLLKLKLKREKLTIDYKPYTIFENIYALYNYMLDNPIENLWFECITIILGHMQILSFAFDEIVRKIYIFLK